MTQDTNKLLSRRSLITGSGIAAVALAAPAIVTAQGRVVRMATSWPAGLGGLATGAQRVADSINAASDGRLTVELYTAGQLVPPLGVHDAAGAGEIEMYHSAEYYFQKKHRGFNFFTTVPFGLTSAEHAAWLRYGGGQELWDELSAQFNVKSFGVGSTGVQMGGWFDKEITSMSDFEGLTMRMPGLGGQVLAEVGSNPVVLPGGGIVEALFEKTIDATEWVGPYNDLQFGFQKLLAKYMYPGFHEPGTVASIGFNLEFWESLSSQDQAIIEMVADSEMSLMSSDYTGNNGLSLTQLIDEYGVKPTRLPEDVWDALAATSQGVVAGVGEDDELAKRIYDSFESYRQLMMGAGPVTQSEYLARRKAEDLFQFI